jgi:hypothetical protein
MRPGVMERRAQARLIAQARTVAGLSNVRFAAAILRRPTPASGRGRPPCARPWPQFYFLQPIFGLVGRLCDPQPSFSRVCPHRFDTGNRRENSFAHQSGATAAERLQSLGRRTYDGGGGPPTASIAISDRRTGVRRVTALRGARLEDRGQGKAVDRAHRAAGRSWRAAPKIFESELTTQPAVHGLRFSTPERTLADCGQPDLVW